ncbi:MAG: carboxyl transferase domain-containing protein [Eubacteriales bacterium]|nr:carboxyl transferase domain-containing protein [Eubacteriales bacterium]
MAQTTKELREIINARHSEASAELEKAGKLTARARMDVIFDEGTFAEVGAFIGDGEEFCPVVTGYGAVDGMLVFAFSQDYSRLHGAMGKAHAKKICKIIEMALEVNAPVIGVFDSAGAKIDEGSDALNACGEVISSLAFSKGMIPTVAVVAGPCGGAGAVAASLCDVIIVAEKTGSLYMVPSSMLEDKTLGKPEKLAETGVSAITAEDDASACLAARAICRYFTPEMITSDDGNRAFDASVFENPKYDVHSVIGSLFDAGSFTELFAKRAPQMTVGLASMNGRVCGVIANNPSFQDGKMCPGACEKAVKLIKLCRTIDVPVVTLVDGVGVGTTDKMEIGGVAGKLAELAMAYSASARKVTVITGEAYGTAYSVLGSKVLGADFVLALDRAKISPMNPVSAVEFLGEVYDESKVDEIAAKWADENASPLEAAKKGYVDDIIEASELRARVASALEMFA